MKILPIAAGLALFACNWACFSQTDLACGQVLDAPLELSAVLTIDSRPAGIEIVGTNKQAIHLSCSSDDEENATHVRLQFSGTASHAKLRINGPHSHHGNLKIRIEVPRKVNLDIQMPAGQVTVNEVEGDKEIGLYAGQISITSAHKWNYRKLDVSVGIGQVDAQVFGTEKGGFFRSFQKENADGEYRLHAHVVTGQIELLGKSASVAADPQ